ncbi:MAG TPA: Tat pathway signal sequence domain protein, partial [Opitutaceae bacterium]|nr:Tat pathway signal sequence domain protein [Opitutaceae bacterium]
MHRFLYLFLLSLGISTAAEPVTLHWLGDAAPGAPNGITWGVPWPKGAVSANTPMRLEAADGRRIDVQTWPLAYWPDGSVKWSGHAIAAAAGLNGPLQLSASHANEERARPVEIKYAEDADTFTIDTGTMRVRVARRRTRVIESITIGERVVAQNGMLIALREDRSQPGAPRDIELRGGIEKATLEQSGPVRAVIKLEGRHVEAGTGGRAWLPFTLRLAFFAGSGAIRLTHSFVYDGDGNRDFLKGIGLSFQVPYKEEPHNRHFRFVGDADGGVWTQPVRMLPGYRPQSGRAVVEHYAAHLAGQRVPNLTEFDERTRNNILTVPLWADAKLTQVGPNNWSLHKRTTADASWLHVTDGRRARGLAVVADVSGGLAVGVKDF